MYPTQALTIGVSLVIIYALLKFYRKWMLRIFWSHILAKIISWKIAPPWSCEFYFLSCQLCWVWSSLVVEKNMFSTSVKPFSFRFKFQPCWRSLFYYLQFISNFFYFNWAESIFYDLPSVSNFENKPSHFTLVTLANS